MTPTPTPVELQNASNSLTSGFADSSGLMGSAVILIAYIVAALLAAQFVAPWIADSELLNRAFGGLATSFAYALKGAAASAVLLLIGAPIYLVATADGETQGLALTAVTGVVALYVVLVGVGWAADRAVQRFIDAHPDLEEWSDLFPETEDDEGGEPA